MKIESKKFYRVTKYLSNGSDSDMGVLPGTDVKNILKGYSFDDQWGMWYSNRANVGYDVQEV